MNFNKNKDLLEESLYQFVESESIDLVEGTLAQIDCDAEERKPIVEQAFRDVLAKIIKISSDDNNKVNNLITMGISAASKDLASTTLPFVLLSDAFDMSSLQQCRHLFNLVEDGLATWQKSNFYAAGKNHLLRMCNDLHGRLSQMQNTSFCGRIQVFLSRLFPPAEKSGVNLMGNFNVDNVTQYDDLSVPEKAEGMDIEDGEMPEKHAESESVLYTKFWSLQDYFRKPVQLYERENWSSFTQTAEDVLNALSSSKLDQVSRSSKQSAAKQNPADKDFFPKYLTNQKLIDLQLGDSNFRRYFLLQMLIISQYLQTKTRFKTATHELDDEQKKWLKQKTELVYTLLRETPPNGQHFASAVEHVLNRENLWSDWKNKTCPNYVLNKPEEKIKAPKRKMTLAEELRAKKGRIQMGTEELTRLWNHESDNLAACRSADRLFTPALETYFAEAIEQSHAAAMIEPKFKLVNQPLFAWRSLRLLARHSPNFFSTVQVPGQAITVYLQNAILRLAKDMNLLVEEESREDVDEEDEDRDLSESPAPNTQDNEGGTTDAETLVSNKELTILGKAIGADWQKVAERLGMDRDMIDYMLSEEGRGDEEERAYNMLEIYLDEHPVKATYGEMSALMKELGYSEAADQAFPTS